MIVTGQNYSNNLKSRPEKFGFKSSLSDVLNNIPKPKLTVEEVLRASNQGTIERYGTTDPIQVNAAAAREMINRGCTSPALYQAIENAKSPEELIEEQLHEDYKRAMKIINRSTNRSI